MDVLRSLADAQEVPILDGPPSPLDGVRGGLLTDEAPTVTDRPFPPSLARVIAGRAERDPDGRAFTFVVTGGPDLHVTNAQLHADAARQARALAGAGVEEGELVVIAGEHGYPIVAAFCGALYRGAVPTIVPYVSERAAEGAYTGRVQRLVEHAGARAVLTLPGLREPFAERLSGSDCAVLTLPSGVGDGPAPPVALSTRGGDDDAYVQFSSGTTSQPKGVVLSHRAVLAYVQGGRESGQMGPGDVFVGWVPLFHDLGLLTCFLGPMCWGATAVLIAPDAWMRRPATLLQAVHDYGGTATAMPTFAFARTHRAVSDTALAALDLSRWRFVICGGEPIVASELAAFADRLEPTGFRPEALVPGYGMAECVLGAVHARPDEPVRVDRVSGAGLREAHRAVPAAPDAPDAVAVTSCGGPAPGMAVRIVGDDGEPVAERGVGEITLRGDFLLSRYWRRPDLTAHALRGGWLHTGDVGYVADGELYVCDRKGDLVIVGGKNVYPDQVEALVRGVLGAKAKFVAAFGLPDEQLGTERLVVVAEPRGRPGDDEQRALAAAVRHALIDEMDLAPADVRFVGHGGVVRTTSGKISRSTTRERYLAAGFLPEPPAVPEAAPGAPLPAPDVLREELADLALAQLGFAPALDANLFEAGADSIRVMELVMTAAERYGRELPTDTLLACPTLDRIAQALTAPGSVALPDLPDDIALALDQAPADAPHRRRLHRRRWVDRVLAGPDGRRRLWQLCGSRTVQSIVFRREARLARLALALVPTDEPVHAVVQRSLFTNTVRLVADGDDLDDRVEVHGADELDAALASGAGVLFVASHSAGRRGLIRALDERAISDGTAVVSRGRVLREEGWTSGQIWAARQAPSWDVYEQHLLSRQYGTALDRLRAGGTAAIAGDGQYGRSGRVVPFFGANRWFGEGFAELAERSGAVVLATFDVLDPDGTLHVHVAPLPPPTAATHDERIAAWIAAYAAQLERYWTAHLGSVRWAQVRRLVRDGQAA